MDEESRPSSRGVAAGIGISKGEWASGQAQTGGEFIRQSYERRVATE